MILGLLLAAWAGPGGSVVLPSAPADWSVPSGAEGPVDPWWRALGDERLAALVTEVLSANLDLQGARDRVQAADALRFQSITTLLPNLSFDAGLSSTPASLRFAQFTGGTAEDVTGLYYFATTTFNASLDLDITGRNVLGVQAASTDRDAVRADEDAVAVALASRVAAAWFDAGLAGQRLELLERLSAANEDLLKVVDLRFSRGEATGVDVMQQRQQVASLRAQLPTVRAMRVVSQQQLAVLLGRPADQAPADLPVGLPELGPPPTPGSPDDLSSARPDLRAAALRLSSAWRRRVAAERGFLPTLRVTANAGWSFTNNAGSSAFSGGGTDLATVLAPLEELVLSVDPTFEGFDTGSSSSDTTERAQSWFTWGFGGSLSIPLFNGGRSIAALQQARAAERQAAHALGQASVQAWAAVEAALASDREQALREAAVREQTEAARSTYAAARARYAEGIADYLSVLTAMVSLQNAELTLLQAHRDALAARMQLHEALGGAWTQQIAGDQP